MWYAYKMGSPTEPINILKDTYQSCPHYMLDVHYGKCCGLLLLFVVVVACWSVYQTCASV